MKLRISAAAQEALAPVPAALEASILLYLEATHHNGIAPGVLAGEAVGAVAYVGVRALEYAGTIRSKTVRVVATTAIGVVLGGLAGAAEASVSGQPILAGIGRGIAGGYIAGLTLPLISPSSEKPAPNDATDLSPAADPWSRDESSLGSEPTRPVL